MSNKLSGSRLQEDTAFAKRFLDQLSEHTVNYADDFVTPPEKRPRRMPVLSLDVADPPKAEDAESSKNSNDAFSITVKSIKPALSFSVQVSPSDSVQQLKTNLSKSTSTAPKPEFQRLLLKGKALADAKLVKEYGLIEGSVVNMMLKPGWDEQPKTGADLGGDPTSAGGSIPVESSPAPGTVPVLTISDADPAAEGTTSIAAFPARPITTMDISNPASGPGPVNSTAEFHNTISDPNFWKKVHAFCQSEFINGSDADGCWHAFLGGVRGKLSPGEIAKIQDAVGITGMGGSPI